MSRHRKILLWVLIGIVLLLCLMLIGYTGHIDQIYAVIRLVLSVVALCGVLALFIQALRRIRKMSNSPEQRLRMGTIMLILAEVTVLLTISAAYDWDRPPPADPILAVVGVMIRASLAFGATILALTSPEDDGNQVEFTQDEIDLIMELREKYKNESH